MNKSISFTPCQVFFFLLILLTSLHHRLSRTHSLHFFLAPNRTLHTAQNCWHVCCHVILRFSLLSVCERANIKCNAICVHLFYHHSISTHSLLTNQLLRYWEIELQKKKKFFCVDWDVMFGNWKWDLIFFIEFIELINYFEDYLAKKVNKLEYIN